MTSHASHNGASATSFTIGGDASLEDLIEECTNRLQRGESVGIEELARDHPSQADRLRRILPSLQMMADVGRSAVREITGLAVPADPTLVLGDLGDFRILREVGCGGMGVVYEAEQISLHRRVALKVLPFAAAMDPTQLRRFQTEALAAAQLHHTHIVPVYSVGSERGVHYYAMQFIEGQTLAAVIQECRQIESPVDPHPPLRGTFSPGEKAQETPLLLGEGGRRPGEGPVRRGSPDLADVDPHPPLRGTFSAGEKVQETPLLLGEGGRRPGEGPVRRGSPDLADVDPHPPLRGTFSAGEKVQETPLLLGEGGRRPGEGGRATGSAEKRAVHLAPVRHGSATPTPSSHTREFFRFVAELGIQAAEALDYAHKVGIIHRDIKPANVLLDEGGNLWITDFGLARFQEDTGLTMTGDLLGTLRYMSPEQALAKRGYLDHRTDIYSLGVTIYELLTLRPAIDGQDRQEVLRKIAQEEPTPPRRLDPTIPRELETILLRAMSKEPASRYATAKELAEDLERFLEHKPIRAKRPTLLERATKWCRRHFAIVGATIAILAFTALSLLVNSVLLSREQRRTATALKLAESQSRLARDAVDKMYTRVAEKWLVDQPGLRPLQREFLEDALAFYQEFALQQGDDPEARIEQAVALRRVGHIQDALNNHEETKRTYLRVIDLLNGLADRPVDNPRRREEMAATLYELAFQYRVDGRIEEAARHYTQALEVYRALSIQHPDRIEYQGEQAACLFGMGATYKETGNSDEAERLFSRSRQIYESLAMRPEARAQSVAGLRRVNHGLGVLYQDVGRFSEALHCWRRTVELSAQILTDSPRSPSLKHDYASDLYGMAGALRYQGKWCEAEKVLREAIRLQEPLAADLPEFTYYREDLAASLCGLGEVLHDLGQFTEEEEVLRRSIGISKEIINATPKLIIRRVIIAWALISLAAHERENGHPDASKDLLSEASSHIRIGLAITPRDPDLSKLSAKIESLATGKQILETAGVWP